MIRRALAATGLLLNIFTAGLALTPLLVSAQSHCDGLASPDAMARCYEQENSGGERSKCSGSGGSLLGFPTWYKYLDPKVGEEGCELSVDFPQSIPAILLAVFEILLRVAALLAVAFVTYGGFQYLTSTGEPDKAKGARTTVINALVGVVIASFATVIVNLIGSNLAP